VAARHYGDTRGHGIRSTVEPEHGEADVSRCRTRCAKRLVACQNRAALGRRESVRIMQLNQPGTGCAAMLHARDDLLADVASLPEIDSAQLIHVDFVGKGIADGEVQPGLADGQPGAMGMVIGSLHGDRTQRFDHRFGLALVGDHPHAQGRQSGIGEGDAKIGRIRLSAKEGHDAQFFGKILDSHFRPQLVEGQPLGKLRSRNQGNIAIEPAAIFRCCLGDEELRDQLALRCQQRRMDRVTGANAFHAVGQQIVEEAARILAAHPHDAPVDEAHSFQSFGHLRAVSALEVSPAVT